MDLTEKRRIHEIARDEGLPSSLVLQRLQRAGLQIKTASSTVTVGEALHLLNPNRYPKPDTLDATLAAAAEAKAAPKKRAKDEADAAAAAPPPPNPSPSVHAASRSKSRRPRPPHPWTRWRGLRHRRRPSPRLRAEITAVAPEMIAETAVAGGRCRSTR